MRAGCRPGNYKKYCTPLLRSPFLKNRSAPVHRFQKYFPASPNSPGIGPYIDNRTSFGEFHLEGLHIAFIHEHLLEGLQKAPGHLDHHAGAGCEINGIRPGEAEFDAQVEAPVGNIPHQIKISRHSVPSVTMNFERPGTLSLTGPTNLPRTLYKLSLYKKGIPVLFLPIWVEFLRINGDARNTGTTQPYTGLIQTFWWF